MQMWPFCQTTINTFCIHGNKRLNQGVCSKVLAKGHKSKTGATGKYVQRQLIQIHRPVFFPSHSPSQTHKHNQQFWSPNWLTDSFLLFITRPSCSCALALVISLSHSNSHSHTHTHSGWLLCQRGNANSPHLRLISLSCPPSQLRHTQKARIKKPDCRDRVPHHDQQQTWCVVNTWELISKLYTKSG